MTTPSSLNATCSCPAQTVTPASTPTSSIPSAPANIDGLQPPAVSGTPISNNANILADTLGVSPLYRQQDTARWQTAAQVYQSSRAHSPVPFATPTMSENVAAVATAPNGGAAMCMHPEELSERVRKETGSNISSPISLEDIAVMNRKRHAQFGGKMPNHEGGPLELEAIAAVHELASHVSSISVSEMLPRTAELIFVNVKTIEGLPYTLELTMKGWRIASTHSDCMNGDYNNVELHIQYYDNVKQVLAVISPNHACHFNHCLTERLNQLKTDIDRNDEENEKLFCPTEGHLVRMANNLTDSDNGNGNNYGDLIFDMHDV